MADEKPLTDDEVLQQAHEVFPHLEWDVDDSLLGNKFVLKTRDIPYFSSLGMTVSFGHPRHSGSFQRDESKPMENSAFPSYSLGGGMQNLERHTGRNCVRDAMMELKQHLLEEINGKTEKLEEAHQLLTGEPDVPSKTALTLSECDRCEGEGRIELFTSVEDPCTKCKGSGMQQNGKIKMGAGCYNPSALSRLKIKDKE